MTGIYLVTYLVSEIVEGERIYICLRVRLLGVLECLAKCMRRIYLHSCLSLKERDEESLGVGRLRILEWTNRLAQAFLATSYFPISDLISLIALSSPQNFLVLTH